MPIFFIKINNVYKTIDNKLTMGNEQTFLYAHIINNG